MSDQKITSLDVAGSTHDLGILNTRPEDKPATTSPITFNLTAFGAVGEITPVTTRVSEPLSAELIKAFGEMRDYFAAHTNRHVLPANFKTEEDAKKFRAQVQQYADENNLTAGFPKHSPAHVTKDTTDKATGKVTKGKPVKDNGIDKTWNVGTNVTFRLTAKRPPSQNGEVTVSNVADAK